MNDFVSVIMPVYNDELYVGKAIESILNQTYKNFEFIIIDDGSTDHSLEIIKRYQYQDGRVRIFSLRKNMGISYALNLGIQKARGKYIARMDSDDISLPRRLATQVSYLNNNRNVVAVGGQAEIIDLQGLVTAYRTFPEDPKEAYARMFYGIPLLHALLMTYTDLLKKCRYEDRTTSEEISMFFQLLKYGDLGNVNEVLYQWRVRQDSNSIKDPKKTFYLTFKSRFKAVWKFGYRPTLKGVLANLGVAPFFLLPKSVLRNLYFNWKSNSLPNLGYSPQSSIRTSQ